MIKRSSEEFWGKLFGAIIAIFLIATFLMWGWNLGIVPLFGVTRINYWPVFFCTIFLRGVIGFFKR